SPASWTPPRQATGTSCAASPEQPKRWSPCSIARSVVDRLAQEVATMATVALTRLDLLDEETPVLLGGGVLTGGHPGLDDGVRELLAARAPKAVPRVVRARPVLGAALLGLDVMDAGPDTQARTRAYFEG
ncbi:hypothetical protein AB0D38_24150, partial [Streptomyces sp. NPDC048279]